MEKFYQICFTRLGGSERSAGWQLTNLSPDIPRRLRDIFEQRQKMNEPTGYDTPRNAQGEPLCALEINSEDGGISLTRIQYGVPCFGREGLFSQGFLFPNAYELLKDPNRILAVSDRNFCFSGDVQTDDALDRFLSATAQIPGELGYEAAWSVDAAMAYTGMTTGILQDLIFSVYTCWAKSVKTTLYVKTDGSDHMVRALLYLIYSALPYSLRPKIVATTFADTRSATLVFTHDIPNGCRFFDPATGSNNVLTEGQRIRWGESRFATLFFDGPPQAFDDLEAQLAQMGDPYCQDTDTLKMALEMGPGNAGSLISAQSDAVNSLFDRLDMRQSYNASMELQVASLLNEITPRVRSGEVTLNKDMEQMLRQRLDVAVSEELKEAYYQYSAARLEQMDLDSACKLLEDSPGFVFDMHRSNLATSKSGRDLLSTYYSRKITPILQKSDCTYEDLLKCTEHFLDLEGTKDLWRSVLKQAESILCLRAGNAIREPHGLPSYRSPIRMALDAYQDFADTIQKSAGIPQTIHKEVFSDFKQQTDKLIQRFLREYYQHFICSFDPDRMDEYKQFFEVDYHDREDMRYGAELLCLYQNADGGKLDQLLAFFDNNCAIEYMVQIDGIPCPRALYPPMPSDYELICSSLLRHWADSKQVRDNIWMQIAVSNLRRNDQESLDSFRAMECSSYRFWELAAEACHMSMVWLMLEKKAVLLCDRNTLARSLQHNPVYWTDERLSQVLQQCTDAFNKGKREAEDCADCLLARQTARRREHEKKEQEAKKKRQEEEKKQRDAEKKRQRETAKQLCKDAITTFVESISAISDPARTEADEAADPAEETPKAQEPHSVTQTPPAPQEPKDADDIDALLTFCRGISAEVSGESTEQPDSYTVEAEKSTEKNRPRNLWDRLFGR